MCFFIKVLKILDILNLNLYIAKDFNHNREAY